MRSFILTVLSIIASIAFSQSKPKSIKWISFEELRNVQKQKPKKVFIDVYTDWCGWCKHMDKTTFSDPEVIDYVNEKFYAVKLNAESSNKILYQGQVLTEAELAGRIWGIKGYPTTVYLNEELNLLSQPVPGFLNKENFLKILKYFGEGSYKTLTWEQYLQGKKQ